MHAQREGRNLGWLGAAAVMLVVLGCTTPPERTPPGGRGLAMTHYRKAQQYVEKQDLDMALVEVQKAIDTDPRAGAYHHLKASLLAQKREYALAEVEYRQAIDREPGYDPSWEGLVDVVAKQGFKENVVKVIQDRLAIAPTSAKWRMRLGMALLNVGDAAGAERELKAAADQAQGVEAAAAHVQLGIFYESRNEPAKALREYEESLRINPDQPKVREIVQQLRAAATPVPAVP
jgi:Tfp pilus assembly protein PilF